MTTKTKAWTRYSITTRKDGLFDLVWETNDDLDEGTNNLYASLGYTGLTENQIACRVYGQYPCDLKIDHSWYGWAYGTPVSVYVDGKLLPFTGEQPDMY